MNEIIIIKSLPFPIVYGDVEYHKTSIQYLIHFIGFYWTLFIEMDND